MSEFQIEVKDRLGNSKIESVPDIDFSMNLMELLKSLEYPITGLCGGMALCASCHIYIYSDISLPPMKSDEMYMLEQSFNQKENSRLACQIPVDDRLNGLKIEIAPE